MFFFNSRGVNAKLVVYKMTAKNEHVGASIEARFKQRISK